MNTFKLKHSLSPSFPKMKLISKLIRNLIWVIVLAGLFWLHHYFQWPTWAFWILIVISILKFIGIIWSFIEPTLLYRSWSYQYDHEYLQLHYGIFTKEWITVPMTKIQAVSTVQGPLMKRFNVYSLKVETMGSSHTIPALDKDVAMEIREIIAQYAKLKEVDE